jgi:hypothetical protein
MDGPTESTGRTVWQATAWATPYLGASTGPTAATPGGTPTNKTRAGGHPPPKNQTPDGPLPQGVQQLCEHCGDPLSIRKAHDGPPHPSKILPPDWPILLVLELRFGEMLPRTSVQVCPGPFDDCITDVISKGVLHYINLPVGEGSGGSPKNKRKGGESAPLRIPDYGWDRVLLDAKRRQSTKELHLNQVLAHVVVNSRSLSGRIGRLGWLEKRGATLQDAWHSGRHRRTMNSNRGRGQQIPQSGKQACRAMTKYPTH